MRGPVECACLVVGLEGLRMVKRDACPGLEAVDGAHFNMKVEPTNSSSSETVE